MPTIDEELKKKKYFKKKEFRSYLGLDETTDDLQTNSQQQESRLPEESQDKPKTKLGQENNRSKKSSDKHKTKLGHEIYDSKEKSDKKTVKLEQESRLPEESQDKPETKLGQESKSSEESQDKPETKLGQESKSSEESQDKVRTKPKTQHRTKLGQSQDKPETKSTFLSLIGVQRKVTLFIFQCCQFVGAKITDPLAIESIAISCDSTKSSTQKTIQRLEKKTILIRKQYKDGRGGWTRYGMPDSIFQEILNSITQEKLRTNLGQSTDKLRTEPRTEPKTTDSSSVISSNVSSDFKKLINTEAEDSTDKSDLPQEWQDIDFLELVKLEVHFGRTHLKQWHDRKYCGPKEAQESIWHFAHFMKTAPKDKLPKTPINFFMGIMSKSKYFSRPDGYVSPEELALKQRNADMKLKAQNLKRLQEESFDLTFDSWFDSLTGREINALTPTEKGIEEKRVKLKNQFRDEFYLTIRDNPAVDLSTLKLKVPTAQDIQTSWEDSSLRFQIQEYQSYLTRHPLDGDTANKLDQCKSRLKSLNEPKPVSGSEPVSDLTPEQVKAIMDTQFGPQA